MNRTAPLLALLLAVPNLAAAQGADLRTEEARGLYELGVVAFDRGEWSACADFFERSFVLVFAPELLYNIGRCYEGAADDAPDRETYARAVRALERYLRELPGADRAEVEARIAGIRARLETLPLPVEPVLEEPAPPLEVPVEPLELEAPDVLELPLEAPRPFGFVASVTLAAVTLATSIVALSLGGAGQARYDELASTCGAMALGCAEDAIASVDAMATAANVFFGIAGALLGGTGLAFGLELSESF